MNKNENFFDSKTIIAIGLVMVVWLGWQNYLAKKYPQANKALQTTETTNQTPPANTKKEVQVISPETKSVVTGNAQEEKLLPVETEDVKFQISSHGMAVKEFYLKKYTDRQKNPVFLGQNGLFEFSLLGASQPLAFTVERKSETEFTGTAKAGAMTVIESLTFDKKNNSFKAQILVQKPSSDFKGFSLALNEKKIEAKSGGFLMPSFEHQDFFVNHQGSLDKTNVTSSKENIDKTTPQASMLAIGSQYFATAMKDKSDVIPEARTTTEPAGNVRAELIYRPVSLKDVMEFNWIGYAGPKSLSDLESIDAEMGTIVNFGIFNWIGRYLLILLKLFYSFVGNWGLAIIILTIIVRMLVLPFNIKSFRSMKKMQEIQPLIKSLKERYKDDPQTMNAETMKLFKEQKVNPVGGCLPMLLQMPVFFALYQVLGQSIELYQAPFFGWIHDLSLKDPFYVLPILMGVAMFAQQKLTPSTMDPAQAKMMQFLPIVFAFMMISLPSGLTLYIFVSTLFGIIQQQLFMKRTGGTVAAGG